MIKIICNRCNKPIESIQSAAYVSKESELSNHEVTPLLEYIKEASVCSNIETLEAEEKQLEPLLREKDFKSEPHSNRRRIDYEKIMSLKESGMRNRDIAAEVGMDAQAVSTAIYTYKKRQGKTAKTERKESGSKEAERKEPQEQEKKVDVGKIRALWNAKWSVSKIADEMGMEEADVSHVIIYGEMAQKG